MSSEYGTFFAIHGRERFTKMAREEKKKNYSCMGVNPLCTDCTTVDPLGSNFLKFQSIVTQSFQKLKYVGRSVNSQLSIETIAEALQCAVSGKFAEEKIHTMWPALEVKGVRFWEKIILAALILVSESHHQCPLYSQKSWSLLL